MSILHNCAFCSAPDIARVPMRIGHVNGYACTECTEGLALVVARYSRKRLTERATMRARADAEKQAVINIATEQLPRARKKSAA